jgi:chromosome partitioning protein
MLLEEEAEVSVIDGSPKSDGTTEALVRASHAVLIPIQPTPADIWAARSVVEIINRIGTPAGLVISRQIVGTNLANAIADELRDRDLPVFDSRVSQRVAYAETMMDGITVIDRPQASKARQEVEGVAGELINLIRRHHDTDAKRERDQ